jgi:hypothetical protein
MVSTAFSILETFVNHLSSFTKVSRLTFVSILQEECVDAFSDSTLVTKYPGGFTKAIVLTVVVTNPWSFSTSVHALIPHGL